MEPQAALFRLWWNLAAVRINQPGQPAPTFPPPTRRYTEWRMTHTTNAELGRIVASLKGHGLSIELLDEGALIYSGETRVALFAQADERGGVLVRLHLDLDLFVEEDAVTEVLLGMNLMNQELDYGSLVLEPVEDEDEQVAFAVMGRSVLWLPDLDGVELRRLHEHLRRFEGDVVGAVERSLQGGGGMQA